jgi:hypothetical protein
MLAWLAIGVASCAALIRASGKAANRAANRVAANVARVEYEKRARDLVIVSSVMAVARVPCWVAWAQTLGVCAQAAMHAYLV